MRLHAEVVRNKTWLQLALLLLVLNGCRVASSTQTRRPYIEFFLESGVTQYYLGPLFFYEDRSTLIQIDYTFRDSTHAVSDVAMNFTFMADELYPEPDSLVYFNQAGRMFSVSKPFDRFYVEKMKSVSHRYGSNLTYDQLKEIMLPENELEVELHFTGSSHRFELNKKSRKIVELVRDQVIIKVDFTK